MISRIENFDFRTLSVEDRLTLIGRIWDSIEEREFKLSAEQCAELDRRVAAEDEAGDTGITWFEMKQRLKEKS